MNLFHKCRYNMKGKLSKFRQTFTDVRCGRPLWQSRRQHDSLVLATPVSAYSDELSRQRPLSAALTAVSLVEVEVRTPCPPHTLKRRNSKALGLVTWGARTSVAHHSVQHSQSNVVEDGRWGLNSRRLRHAKFSAGTMGRLPRPSYVVARMCSTTSLLTDGRPVLFPLHKQPFSSNYFTHLVMLWQWGASLANLVRKYLWTTVTDEVLACSSTQ
jgi:hypothetical protein